MHGLVEKWGLPAIIMCLGDIGQVLSEDAEQAKNLTANQRGLILGACAQSAHYQIRCMQKWTLSRRNHEERRA